MIQGILKEIQHLDPKSGGNLRSHGSTQATSGKAKVSSLREEAPTPGFVRTQVHAAIEAPKTSAPQNGLGTNANTTAKEAFEATVQAIAPPVYLVSNVASPDCSHSDKARGCMVSQNLKQTPERQYADSTSVLGASLEAVGLPVGPSSGAAFKPNPQTDIDNSIRLNTGTTHTQIQVNSASTYASLVDLNDGNALDFIPALIINGNKYAQLAQEDAEAEIKFWKSAVICAVLGANPPLKIWGAFELDRIIQEVLIRQPVKFEWLPSKCNHCAMFGHLEDVCRKKPTPRKEWRRVDKEPDIMSSQAQQQQHNPSPVSPNPLQLQGTTGMGKRVDPITDSSGFTLVSKKATSRSIQQHSSPVPMAPNSPPPHPTPTNVPRSQVNPSITYASMLDPDTGNSLKFIPAELVNGVTCAKLEPEDVLDELNYWKSSVLCSVLGSNPPFEIIQKFIRRLWAQFEIDQILQVRRGLFLVRFVHHQDKLTVISRGFYFFGNKPFVVKGWNADLNMNTENLKSIPLWIRLPDLELRYWGLASLSKIGSLIGTPVKTDQFTKSKSMIQYARMLIDVPIEGPFPDYVEFFNERGQLIRQQVHFEWKPTMCTYCHMQGHTNDVCRKKKVARQEWRPISKQTPPYKGLSPRIPL
ncbi:hypothetical protein Cgig2_017057 [Carnegiea gigantea]|uniref:DUF4283 domain-containing protein n=1 Tax=Carnegiea gigantea TaxID=171969 RepID=A0A9Q1GLF6_9CARY|nr:hypothetical protein Cgig2_017057 [Carnegiea gigantea]